MAKTESPAINALIASSQAVALPAPTIDLPGDRVRADDWFEETGAVDLDETWFATEQIRLRPRNRPLISTAIGLLAIAIGVLVAVSVRSSDRSPAVPAAAPSPSPGTAPAAVITSETPARRAATIAVPEAVRPLASQSSETVAPATRSVAVSPSSARAHHLDTVPKRKKGVLMISTKPPCNIVIDGVRTGLLTPQRAIPLSPGQHEILLVNEDLQIRKSFSVAITAGRATRLLRSFIDN